MLFSSNLEISLIPQVILDVQQFAPNEISVKTQNNVIIVEAKHEEKQDEHGFIFRHFVRKYILPEDTEVMDITSSLSSDGVLTISAPKKVILVLLFSIQFIPSKTLIFFCGFIKAVPALTGERVIHINQTGQPAPKLGVTVPVDVIKSPPETASPSSTK